MFAPSLLRVPRPCVSCKGGDDAAHTTLCLYRNAFADVFVVPALRKMCEERGTHSVGAASEIKSPGHPPSVPGFEIASMGPLGSGSRKPVPFPEKSFVDFLLRRGLE